MYSSKIYCVQICQNFELIYYWFMTDKQSINVYRNINVWQKFFAILIEPNHTFTPKSISSMHNRFLDALLSRKDVR